MQKAPITAKAKRLTAHDYVGAINFNDSDDRLALASARSGMMMRPGIIALFKSAGTISRSSRDSTLYVVYCKMKLPSTKVKR